MRIIAVDDEVSVLNILKRTIAEAVENADIACFDTAHEALVYAKNNVVDIAFIDVEMPVTNGLSLAKGLKDIYRETNIIFVTGYKQYAETAFRLRASGYVLKPIDPERVKEEIDNLRNPIRVQDKGVYIQCFGNFEIYVDGVPVIFARSKSKEILAYLVDKKGLKVSKKELAAVVLEKDEYTLGIQSYVHNIIAEAGRALKEAGADDVLIKQHGQYFVDISKFNCDYYDYSNENSNSRHDISNYMANYNWTEYTIDTLE